MKDFYLIYSRYLKSLEDKDSNVGGNFAVMNKLLVQLEDKALRGELYEDIVYQTVKVIAQRGINCKSSAPYWDYEAVQEFYKRLDNLNKAMDEVKKDGGSEESVKILTHKLYKHIDQFEEKNPWLTLYMYLAYSRTFAGSWLRKNTVMMASHQRVMDKLRARNSNDPRLTVQAQIIESSKTEEDKNSSNNNNNI